MSHVAGPIMSSNEDLVIFNLLSKIFERCFFFQYFITNYFNIISYLFHAIKATIFSLLSYFFIFLTEKKKEKKKTKTIKELKKRCQIIGCVKRAITVSGTLYHIGRNFKLY